MHEVLIKLYATNVFYKHLRNVKYEMIKQVNHALADEQFHFM